MTDLELSEEQLDALADKIAARLAKRQQPTYIAPNIMPYNPYYQPPYYPYPPYWPYVTSYTTTFTTGNQQ